MKQKLIEISNTTDTYKLQITNTLQITNIFVCKFRKVKGCCVKIWYHLRIHMRNKLAYHMKITFNKTQVKINQLRKY